MVQFPKHTTHYQQIQSIASRHDNVMENIPVLTKIFACHGKLDALLVTITMHFSQQQ